MSDKRHDALAQMLADTFVLSLKTKNFHWNVSAPHFNALHALFEEQYKALDEAMDTLAEEIRKLEGHAPAALQTYQKLAKIKCQMSEGIHYQDMVSELEADNNYMIKSLSDMIGNEAIGFDPSTDDMLTELLSMHKKFYWMLKSSV